MPSRTYTAYESLIALPNPDNRKFDFADAPSEPYSVRITVPKKTTWKRDDAYWNESYNIRLKCVQGRCHTFYGTGMYNNVDSFFGAGSEESYGKFELHYWQRSEDWQTAMITVDEGTREMWIYTPLLERGLEETGARECQVHAPYSWMEEKSFALSAREPSSSSEDGDLIVELNPFSSYYESFHAKRHELYYRHLASVHLDAPIYPYLSTTPLPIRVLFALPTFIFPAILRHRLIRFFLSIQLLVLYSTFDYHPNLGSFPFTFLYGLIYWRKYWMPGNEYRYPEWACRAQWESMVVISHVKVWIWAGIGRKLLGMSSVYDEYTPERLKDALDEMPGDWALKRESSMDAAAFV